MNFFSTSDWSFKPYAKYHSFDSRFSDRVLALIAYAMVMTTFFLYIPMGSKRLKIAGMCYERMS